ncbi:MAG: hypothetical protein M1837_004159 [Sclerophora amabilis]|nr:MAG: hypothetical protein M1837_004159 [Sclerophora amabilis]
MPSFNFPFSVTLAVALSATATLVLISRLVLTSTNSKTSRRTIASPRDTLLPYLSRSQALALPYPPDLLPGARDVDTPYGVMRVYEWGPEEGRKVVMVHGDTTPAPLWGPIGKALVERGCRVLVLDLWGRGYSDTPLNLPHDARLFAMQIFFALASSPLSWTGDASGGFSIIGFSLGGGITVSFAARFPYLINSIILLAPAGILRSMPGDYESIFFRFPSIFPSSYVRKMVGRVLGVDLETARTNAKGTSPVEKQSPQESRSWKPQKPDVPAVVQWQFDNHQGFVHSFINTIQHGPIMHQQSEWKILCDIIKGESLGKAPGGGAPCKLHNSKILAIFGDADAVVVEREVSKDLGQMLGGPDHVEFKTVPGSHGFPIPSSEEVVKHISDFWELKVID